MASRVKGEATGQPDSFISSRPLAGDKAMPTYIKLREKENYRCFSDILFNRSWAFPIFSLSFTFLFLKQNFNELR